uniref:SJCHGC08953 protein n=1 Tax=Schistosoma japonicum TaxID=6182 RepID=Q5DCK8_SCHJA|nr:SJCHGC08953 protein [Schistosoma japonicum]
MELSDGDLLNKSEEYEHAIDEQIPAIYTSEDERIPTPAVLSDTSRSPVFPDNRQKTVQPLKGDIKYTESNAYSLSIPTKKARLSISSGLVSYAIDDDDDEHNVIDTDQNTDSDDNESSSKSQSGHEFHLGSIDLPLDTLGQPPTIFSSDQPINISSQNQGHILEPSNDIKNPNLLTNEIKPESPILTERLIHVVQLPPEPTGHCSMVLQERVERAVRRMRLDISYDPNRAIQDNKAFRNPSIYEKLIDFLKIDEKGTNFSTDIYDPYRWSPQSYYEELAKVQNREIDRLMKIQKELKKSEVNTTSANNMCGNAPKNPNSISADTDKPNTTSGGSVLTGYIEPRKPSKWDSGIPSNIQPHETTSSETMKISVPSVGSLIKQS